ncbi:MAG: 16S rRNA (cytosine(1402)-N(4))-methyltransferase RsmH [Pyrinomonadaceae bacterium]|nr:16S rRNA (cytosine(1402)-N(4))-methyltransferase RsmH [Pyrinomonadaceae bacterium]
MDVVHRSVLLQEATELLAPQRGGLFVDATLGLGGHSEALLEASTEARALGIDRDRAAIETASARLTRFGERFRVRHANFRDIKRVLEETGESEASGVLADLGVSSLQFENPERGFSFRHDAPLDMRMDPESSDPTAAELLAELPEEEIARIIWEYGEERGSRRIARWIVERREQNRPIERTGELAELVARAVGYRHQAERTHPATRTFQALRIAVNGELEGLDLFIETAIDLLQPEGRLVVISFHSLEDRIVKRTLRRLAGGCECDLRRLPICLCGARRAVEILTKRAVVPTETEVNNNPRARSAKLRACRKLVDTRVVEQ